MLTSNELLTGAALDLLLGDPPWLPHPIRAIGSFATYAERFWRATRLPLRLAGTLFWCTVTGTTLLCVRFTLPRARIYWIYSLLACRDLDRQSAAVIKALHQGNLPLARQKLSLIVGRDTALLDEPGVVRAVLETVAENSSDGIVAPLFYLALAGPLGMALYKAANTLDSMVGYRNERYLQFGWFSARADDFLNFIPARLTALLVWITAALLPACDGRRSLRITLRDGHSQPSPNAGYPEAAFAGALGVQLGGLNFYAGRPSPKSFLGDPIHPLHRSLYTRTRLLLYGSTALLLGLLSCTPLVKKSCR